MRKPYNVNFLRAKEVKFHLHHDKKDTPFDRIDHDFSICNGPDGMWRVNDDSLKKMRRLFGAKIGTFEPTLTSTELLGRILERIRTKFNK